MKSERFEEFTLLISGIYNNIQRIKSKYIKAFDLKSVHILWIYLLNSHPTGLTATELAELAKTDKSLVSREINELVEKGIVKTEEKGSRRRYGWKFFLTEKGVTVSEEISRVVKIVQNTVDDGISIEELQTFYRTLNILADNFDRFLDNKGVCL